MMLVMVIKMTKLAMDLSREKILRGASGITKAAKPGDKIGETINKGDAICTLSEAAMFNPDGSVTGYGRDVQEVNLKIDSENGGEYKSVVKEDILDVSVVGSDFTTINVKQMTKEASENLLRQLTRTGVMDRKQWREFTSEFRCQTRKSGEFATDSKDAELELGDFLAKDTPERVSKKIVRVNSNRVGFTNYSVYDDKANDNEYSLEYDESIAEYVKSGVLPSGEIIVDDFGNTKIKVINKVVEIMNTTVKATVQKAKKNKSAYQSDIHDIFVKDILLYLEDNTGIDRDRIRNIMYVSMSRVNQLVNTLQGRKLSDDMKVLIIAAIATELKDLFDIVVRAGRREETARLVKEEGLTVEEAKIEAEAVVRADKDIDFKMLISYAFEASTKFFGINGGCEGAEKFFRGIKDENGINVNPFYVKRPKDDNIASDKVSDRTFNLLYKVFGNTMALVIRDKNGDFGKLNITENTVDSWGIFDITEPGVYSNLFVKDLQLKDIKIAVMDAVRDAAGNVSFYHSNLVYDGFMGKIEGYNKKEFSQDLKDHINKSLEFYEAARNNGATTDITNISGEYVANNAATRRGSVKYDKFNTPNVDAFNLCVYGKDNKAKYSVGTTGNNAICGYVSGVFDNILLVENVAPNNR